MRICSPHGGISPESVMGGEVYEREILKNLAFLGAKIEIILPKNKPYPKGIENWHIHYLPISRGLRWYVSTLVFPRYIKKIYDTKGFDLLRIHALKYAGPAVFLTKKLYKIDVPVVAHHHHLDPDMSKSIIIKKVLQNVDLIITDSNFSKRQLIEKIEIDGNKIKVVYCGINRKLKPLPKDEELMRRYDLKEKKVLLWVGGLLRKRKNLPFLLEVFRELINLRGNTIKLLIVGSGKLLGSLKRKAQELGIEHSVIFTGYVPESEKVKYYNLADALVLSSLLEGFGLVVGEAMSCGKPVVISNIASLPEVVENGKTGFLVQSNSREDFIKKIITLLDNEELCIKFGKEGMKRVENLFRWDISARKVLKLYEGVLEKCSEKLG